LPVLLGSVVGRKVTPVPEPATSCASPSTIAAMTGLTPKISVSVTSDAFTAAASFFFVWLIRSSRRCRSSRKSLASCQRGLGRAGRLGGRQQAGRVRRRDLLPDAAGDQVAQHRAQPAGDLIAGPPQVPAAGLFTADC
jgi:hypothetical protein